MKNDRSKRLNWSSINLHKFVKLFVTTQDIVEILFYFKSVSF